MPVVNHCLFFHILSAHFIIYMYFFCALCWTFSLFFVGKREIWLQQPVFDEAFCGHGGQTRQKLFFIDIAEKLE